MKRLFFAFALALAGLVLSAPAQALTNFDNAPSGAHYAHGYVEPTCGVSGATVTCTATEIAGVGNTAATVSLAATTTFTGVCHNPGNYNVVDPFTRTVPSPPTTSTLTPDRHGVLWVSMQSTSITTRSQFLATFSCPNPNWTAEVTTARVSWTYTLTFDGFSAPAISISGSANL